MCLEHFYENNNEKLLLMKIITNNITIINDDDNASDNNDNNENNLCHLNIFIENIITVAILHPTKCITTNHRKWMPFGQTSLIPRTLENGEFDVPYANRRIIPLLRI